MNARPPAAQRSHSRHAAGAATIITWSAALIPPTWDTFPALVVVTQLLRTIPSTFTSISAWDRVPLVHPFLQRATLMRRGVDSCQWAADWHPSRTPPPRQTHRPTSILDEHSSDAPFFRSSTRTRTPAGPGVLSSHPEPCWPSSVNHGCPRSKGWA